MQNKSEKRLFSIKEACHYTGFAQQTFYDWIYKRKIDFVKISRRVFIKRETLDALIDSCTVCAMEVRPERGQ